MNIQDRRKTLTVEELRRRYNLDALDKDRKAIKLQKDQLNKVDAELNDFVEITTKNIKELQDQVDGNITTWFFNGVPTVDSEPASSWITDTDKNNHLGDLYYDQDTGYAYRFYLDGTTNEYGWIQVIDSDVAEVLAIANAAKDTADSKRRVFVAQPIPPYDIGDIWIKEDTDLYRCRASRSEGSFNIVDWIRATNYTDDTVALGTKAELDQFKTQVTENYVSNATLETTVNSITGKVEETYTYVTTVENQVVDITKTTNEVEGGNSLYIIDSLESNALEYHIEGKSEQGRTPTPDAPVEIKTIPSIRNLFDKDSAILGKYYNSSGQLTGSNNWCYQNIKVLPNTDYKISGNTTNNTVAYFVELDENLNFIKIIGHYNHGTSFKTTNKTKYVGVSVPYYNGDYRNNKDTFKLEVGTVSHDYVPYGAWAKVKITGANSFDIDRFNANLSNIGRNYMSVFAIENGFSMTSTGNDAYFSIGTITNANRRFLMRIKPNTKYTLSYVANGSERISKYIHFFDKNYNDISRNNSLGIDNPKTFTTPENAEYCFIRFGLPNQNGITTTVTNILLSSDTTEYEAYKEKEVLIDLNKPNLFDKDNFIKTKLFSMANNILGEASALKSFIFDVSNYNTITIQKISGARFGISATVEYPVAGGSVVLLKDYNNNDTSATIDVSKYNYILVGYWTSNGEEILTEQEVLNSIKIYEGYSPYYELSSIGDTKDTLDIIDGQVVIDKMIEKIVLDGSESWGHNPNNGNKFINGTGFLPQSKGGKCISSHYPYNVDTEKSIWIGESTFLIIRDTDSTTASLKTWLSENNVTVYYILAEPQQITLPNTNIELFEGVNHITLVDDLETTTSIKFLRQTPISSEYALNQDLDITNSNLANTTNQTNQNASDINATNTNLNNNYYNKEQIDVMNTSTQEIVTQIKNTVETTTTATNLQISILQEQLTNGVTKVDTGTGYTFDINGLKIQKTDSEMSSLLDNDGLVVKRNTTEVLTVRSSGVETENLTVRTYFTIGDNTRVENYKDGTGFFYIGGAN